MKNKTIFKPQLAQARLYELSEANVRFHARFAFQPNRIQAIFGAFDAILGNWLSWAHKSVLPWSQDWFIAAGAYPGFCSMKRLGVFLLPLDGMLVHRRSLPSNFVRFPQQFAGTHLYSWVERGTVRVKCLAQEHNTMSPARARTRTARSGDKRTNHKATTAPTTQKCR